MDIQKLILVLIVCWILCSCNTVESGASTAVPITTSSTDQTANCLDELYLSVADSILLYYIQIAADSVLLEDHAGNYRKVITKQGASYYSSNKSGIQDLQQYFNDSLRFYQQLTSTQLQNLKDSIESLQLTALPALLNEPEILSDGGNITYFYVNYQGKQNCSKITTYQPMEKRLTELMKQF